MKNFSKLILAAALTGFVITLSGCSLFGSLNKKSSLSKATSDNYTLIDAETMKVSSSCAGKTAFLVKVNYGSNTVSPKASGYAYSSERSACEENTDISETKELFYGDEEHSFESHCGFERANIYMDKPVACSEREATAYVPYEEPDYKLGDTDYFYIDLNDDNTTPYSYKEGTLKAIGTHCFVWYFSSSKSFIKESEIDFDTVAEKFDQIYSTETSIFGSTQMYANYNNTIKTTSDHHVNILVFDIYGDAVESNTNSGTYGFFRSHDFFLNSKQNINNKDSNERLVINVDSWILQSTPGIIYSTLAHEFQHLLNYVSKGLNNNQDITTWFTEMQSLLCEEIFQHILNIKDEDSPKDRLYYFNATHHLGFGDYTWTYAKQKGYNGGFDYSNTYAFGTYLMHNYGGIDLIHQIAVNSYIDEDAITNALKTLGYDDDFTSVLCKFGQIIANYDGTSSNFLTLNKSLSANSKYSYIGLDAIDLTQYDLSTYTTYKNLVQSGIISNNSGKYNKVPYIYQKSENISLLPYGISVHYLGKIGEDGSTFSFTLPSDDKVAMFLMIK